MRDAIEARRYFRELRAEAQADIPNDRNCWLLVAGVPCLKPLDDEKGCTAHGWRGAAL